MNQGQSAQAGYSKPLPLIHPENQPFWGGLKNREVRMQRCSNCGVVRYPVSPVCYKCFSDAFEWATLSGLGTVAAWIEVVEVPNPAWAKDVPYNVALVELDEGPRVTTNLIDVTTKALRNGMRVQAVFVDVTPEVAVLKFKPLDRRQRTS